MTEKPVAETTPEVAEALERLAGAQRGMDRAARAGAFALGVLAVAAFLLGLMERMSHG